MKVASREQKGNPQR